MRHNRGVEPLLTQRNRFFSISTSFQENYIFNEIDAISGFCLFVNLCALNPSMQLVNMIVKDAMATEAAFNVCVSCIFIRQKSYKRTRDDLGVSVLDKTLILCLHTYIIHFDRNLWNELTIILAACISIEHVNLSQKSKKITNQQNMFNLFICHQVQIQSLIKQTVTLQGPSISPVALDLVKS